MILQRLYRSFWAWRWASWPDRAYQNQGYRQRLSTVQSHLAESLHGAPTGRVRILSICAGDGRDVIGVLPSHPRRADVSAALVEQSERSIKHGQADANAAGISGVVSFLHGDATLFETYRGIAPAEIVLFCGVWGHVPARERQNVVQGLSCLCRPGGVVIWTRGIAKGMDRLQQIEAAFEGRSWQKSRLSFTADQNWAVVTQRYCGPALEVPADGRFFSFETGAGTRQQNRSAA